MRGGRVGRARRRGWLSGDAMAGRRGVLRPSSLRLKDGRRIRFPAVTAVLNVTPDSFSDGGLYLDARRAVERGLELAAAGADIVEVGAESTRPGAAAVAVEEELARLVPVLEGLGSRLKVPISVDTRKAEVARRALALGAAVVNDVSGLRFDPAMAAVAAQAKAAVVLMHMRGTPATMGRMARYRDVVAEVKSELAARARMAVRCGIRADRILLDPGFGFAKKAADNLKLLRGLPQLCRLGYPIMVGVSRKRFLRRIAGSADAALSGATVAASLLAVLAGASLVRVHEPGPAAAALKVVRAWRALGAV